MQVSRSVPTLTTCRSSCLRLPTQSKLLKRSSAAQTSTHGIALLATTGLEKGDGPLAELLIKKTSDLTRISRDNGGIFPSEHLFEVIAGRKDVAGHQTFQMPGFWDRFRQTEGQCDYNSAETRIREIVNYL